MTHLPIGIDLGTTNSLIAVFEGGAPRLIPNSLGDFLTPSVVAETDQGDIIVGSAAKARLITAPTAAASVFKRAMGAPTRFMLGKQKLSAEDLSALLLRQLKADAEAHLGQPVEDVVVSVPAYFNEVQRRAVRSACALANLNPVRLINEPSAAALAYGLQDRAAEETSLVFDLGGGTFDVSILETFEGVFEIRASAGDAQLGGEDFTELLMGDFAARIGGVVPRREAAKRRAVLYNAAERMKRSLTNAETALVELEIDGEVRSLRSSRAEFDELAAPLFERLRRPIERALHDADVAIDEINRVLLVGGANRMPMIRSYVARMFGKLPEGRIDPDEVVALGAATQAGFVARDEALEDLVMTDVSAFSLGISTSRELSRGWVDGFFAPVIERNNAVPTSKTTQLRVAIAGQSSLHVQVYQGEAPMVADNILLGGFIIPVPKNTETRESAEIRFTYDVSGLLQVEATASDGVKRSIVIEGDGAGMSEDEIKARLKELEKLKINPREESENVEIIERMRECYEMALGVDRNRILQLISDFEDALQSQERAEIEIQRKRAASFLEMFEQNYVR